MSVGGVSGRTAASPIPRVHADHRDGGGRGALGAASAWWQSGWYAALLVLLSVVPLALPAVPPLVDVPGHIGRLHLMLGPSPFLAHYFSPGPLPLGNLGVDLIVYAIGPFLGAELAVRIVVRLIPPATVAAMLWVAREEHGALPATAAFAVPLAYSYPFLFGFINFSLGLAIALASFAVWLRLGNGGRVRRRALIMAPLGLLTFVAHVASWGLLGLMAFSAEVARRRSLDENWPSALRGSVVQCLPLALPVIPLLLWRHGVSGGTFGWLDLAQKVTRFVTIFRDRWIAVDLATLFVLLALLLSARGSKYFRWSAALGGAAAMILLAFLLLPGWLFGSAYADMRIAPAILIMAVLAIGVSPKLSERLAQRIAIAALGFAVLRIAAVTVSLHLADGRYQQLLGALDYLPRNSRLAVLVDHRLNAWPLQRNDHLGSMAIVRRNSFSNDQWELEGASSLAIHYPAAGRFESDDSQLVADGDTVRTMAQSLAELPTNAFDALWLIDSAPRPDPAGWVRVYHVPGGDLYLRADRANAARSPEHLP